MQGLDRSWQAKVTTIKETKDLTSMSLATLFGKLREHKQKLHIFDENEQLDKKGKGVSMKVSSPEKGKEKTKESSPMTQVQSTSISWGGNSTNFSGEKVN
uniref:Uncharacterized protein n=1 Tax=Cajanus cajan TaxID=3821 RepID=A0A151U4I3_CAJCA|nr:hypothetical protein KK1_006876 [Cajanus cajan]